MQMQSTEASKLEQKIIGLIYDEIPVNLICPYCERDLKIENVLNPDSGNRADQIRWLHMVRKIVNAVKEHVNAAVREEA